MELVRRLSLVVAFTLCYAFGGPVRAQWVTEPFAPRNDISFTIFSDRSVYSVLDEITVSYRVVNISSRSRFVPRTWMGSRCPESPNVMAWFEDSLGRRTMLSFVASCAQNLPDPGIAAVPLLLRERLRREALLLKPDEHFDGTIALGSATAKGLPPGKYRIEAAFSGWSDSSFSDAERADLPALGSTLLRGSSYASMRVTLTR